MNIIEKLAKILQSLPGIGPRQAKRLAYSFLNKDSEFINQFSFLLKELKIKARRCPECFYTFETNGEEKEKCAFCANSSRDKKLLMVVLKEIDLENIEKTNCYNGKYFVLGGTVPLLAKDSLNKIRMKELFYKIKEDTDIKEIIIAMNQDKEGEATNLYIGKILEPFLRVRGLKITSFGKGLSSGSEIEYADKNTIEHAFLNRK